LLDTAKTGDFILFETPKTMPDLFHIIPSLSLGCNHIGIVVLRNGVPYFLESDYKKEYCHISRREKTGVKCIPLEERLSYVTSPMHIIKTNLYQYIDKEDQINAFFERYKDKEYMEDGVQCMYFLLLFLQEFNVLQNHYSLPVIIDYSYLLDPDFYRVPFSYTSYRNPDPL